MGETNGQAAARMACLDCGNSGATAYTTTKGANPGRLVRICDACWGRWAEYGLKTRDLLPGERQSMDAE